MTFGILPKEIQKILCIAVLAGACICAPGCGGRPEILPPQRLIDQRLAEIMSNPPAPLDLMGLDWKLEDMTLERSDDGWLGQVLRSGGVMTVDVDLDSLEYTTLVVELQAAQGTKLAFGWEAEHTLPVDAGKNLPKADIALMPGMTHQAYRIPLSLHTDNRWAGRIKRLSVAISDLQTVFSLRRVALEFDPDAARARLTLNNVTRDVIFGAQRPWTVRVPEGGVFETHLALHPDAWQQLPRGTVSAQVRLRDSEGVEHFLYQRRLSPYLVGLQQRWIPVRIDLSRFAGQEVSLLLETGSMGIPYGDWVFWGCPMVHAMTPRRSDIPVILISTDTLRADHMSVYGYAQDTTPKLKAWAEQEAVVFETAITPETWTLPSHMSMMTGLYPTNHGVRDLRNLDERVVTLAEKLRGNGYLTAGFTGQNWWLLGSRGFAHGFDVYDTPEPVMRHIYETDVLVQDWLDGHPVNKQFLFFHNFDVHSKLQRDPGIPWLRYIRNPYDAGDAEFRVFSKDANSVGLFKDGAKAMYTGHDLLAARNRNEFEFTPEEDALITLLYDDSVRLVDQSIFEFFESLKRRGLYDNALIIFTSDHGEKLGEAGQYSHTDVYEPEAHVPLIVKFPGGRFAGTRYAPMVSTVSLYPTVLDVLGLEAPHAMDGPSLLALVEGRAAPPEFVYIGLQSTSISSYGNTRRAVRSSDWKMRWVLNPQEPLIELLDVHEKPLDITDRRAEKPDIAAAHWNALRPYLFDARGWHVRAHSPAGLEEIALNINTAGGFREALVSYNGGDFVPVEIGESGGIAHKLFEGGTFEAILRADPQDAPIQIEARGPARFTALLGGRAEQPEGALNVSVSAVDAGGWTPAPADWPEGPYVAVWHVADDAVRGVAPAPDEEMQETLKALGYLQ